eukprot:Blabericola_migrator_1__2106@NODE_1580_length_4237_cov_221_241487_g1032_i0_p2_GENE_NODE_1580_length_4237_cov_221_241487_g1032_i0NODE_1580_length_4237_cov_221_241487_g1032_i0_p2_ORF_typecomplete_len280_score57_28Sod_Fe_C/PF02777_18/1_4e04Sod_Fe_C/PF02777_18/1_4e04Sod_Fe_C/PF02777_18/4_4e03Sod_Fe_C/PF02777_18/1_6e37Sod_Fe_N/PF00081_22/4_5e22_NODE_1580_length_4237_cov_221_241487_g1032_i033974197
MLTHSFHTSHSLKAVTHSLTCSGLRRHKFTHTPPQWHTFGQQSQKESVKERKFLSSLSAIKMFGDYSIKPELPYPQNALAPYISENTLAFHYGKHHLTYYNNMMNITAGAAEYKGKSLDELAKTAEGKLKNQACQTYNHNFYWKSMRPNPDKKANAPSGLVEKLINESFSSYQEFHDKFSASATAHFGSGWVWLVLNPKTKKLEIVDTHDADCPIRGDRGIPILTCDVWEHAYYLDYQNARAKYLEAWWSLVNWDFANQNLERALA